MTYSNNLVYSIFLLLPRNAMKRPPLSLDFTAQLAWWRNTNEHNSCLTLSSSFCMLSIPRLLLTSPFITLEVSLMTNSAGNQLKLIGLAHQYHYCPLRSVKSSNHVQPLSPSVQKCLQLEAQSCLGSPVLYQLIEVTIYSVFLYII